MESGIYILLSKMNRVLWGLLLRGASMLQMFSQEGSGRRSNVKALKRDPDKVNFRQVTNSNFYIIIFREDPISWSNCNLEMLVLVEGGKPEYPEKNLLEQGREPTTNSTHIWSWAWESNPGHIGGRWALSPLHQPCSPQRLPRKVRNTLHFVGFPFCF